MSRKFRSKPIPVKLDEQLLKRIEEVAAKMGEPKSTVMRIAMRVGLEGLDKVFEAAPGIASDTRKYGEHKPDNLALNEPANSPHGAALEKEVLKDVLSAGRKPRK